MVWAIALAVVLLLSPVRAYAIEGENDAKVSQESPGNNLDETAVIQKIDDLEETIIAQNGTIQTLLSTINVTLSDIKRQTEPQKEESKKEGEKDTEDYLIGIQKSLDNISSQLESPVEQEQKSVTRAGNTSFVAYTNVSPTGSYATYANGLIPRLKWDEHYCFLQDTSSSYVFIWGKSLEYSDTNTFTGNSCRYVRWFYHSQSVGYQTESGTADVSVSTNGHVVLSDLALYPMLTETEHHAFRMEVAFYACVALVIRTLHHVWRFTLRNGNGTMAD